MGKEQGGNRQATSAVMKGSEGRSLETVRRTGPRWHMLLPTMAVTFLAAIGQPGGLPMVQAQSTPAAFDLIADQAPVSLAGDLPAHDPTVGRVAGDGGVSGGAASYEIPIAVPPGRRGMQPSLSLVYSSRSGNGIAGMGWSLSGLSSLHRCPQTLEQDGTIRSVQMDAQDRLCLDGQRLVLMAGSYGMAGATYGTEMESFVRVTQLGGGLGSASTYFKVERKSGEIAWYGNDVDARVIPGGLSVPLTWMIKTVQDRVGNAMHYGYTNHGNGEVLVNNIWYTGTVSELGTRRVSFLYENRPNTGGANDQSSSYLAGGVSRQTKRLTSITTFVGSEAVRGFILNYGLSAGTGRSLLQSVTDCAHDGAGWVCRPPTTFAWQQGAPTYQFKPLTIASEGSGLDPGKLISLVPAGDYNGDGTVEMIWSQQNSDGSPAGSYLVSIGSDRVVRQAISMASIPSLISIDSVIDFDLDGKADLLGRDASGNAVAWFWRGPMSANSFATAFTESRVLGVSNILQTADMDGDGRTDIITHEENPSGGNACTRLLKVWRNRVTGTGGGAGFVFDEIASHCLASYGVGTSRAYESLGRLEDFNGDGLTDIWIQTSGYDGAWGANRLLQGTRTSCGGASCYGYVVNSIDSLFPASDPRQPKEVGGSWGAQYGYSDGQHIWMDFNGDGLVDVLYPSGTGWGGRLNMGGRFGPRIQVQGTYNDGLGMCHAVGTASEGACDIWVGRYIRPFDYDSDGRQELAVPRQYAARFCFYQAPTPNIPEMDPTYVCPEAIDGTDDIGHEGGFMGGVQTDVVQMYGSGLGHWNTSKYYVSALKFVETGANQFRVEEVQTNIITGPSQIGSHADFMGDGHGDVAVPFTCASAFQWCGVPTKDWQGVPLSEQASPRTLPDGSSPKVNRFYLNENLGPGGVLNTDAASPRTSDILTSATDAFGNSVGWTYYTLASNAGRTSGQTPLYTIPETAAGRYIDERHFYFSSSMPVVSEMRRTDGIGGQRVWRYGYSEAMYHAQGRGFQGFRAIIEEDVQGGLRTTTTFHQKFPLTSQPERVVVNPLSRSGEDGAISREQYTWRCDRASRSNASACVPAVGTQTRYFPFLDIKDAWTYDATTALSGGTPAVLGHTQEIAANDNACSGAPSDVSGYDAYGNLTARSTISRDLGSGSASGTANRLDKQCISETSTYAVDTTDWWLDKLTAKSATTQVIWDSAEHALPAGTSNPARTVSSTYVWNADRTLANETLQAGIANQQRVTTYAYPSSGNYGMPTGVAVAADGDPNGTRSTGTTYTADGYFPALVVNALGHNASTSVRARDGQPTLVTDANGLRTLIEYDAFGFAIRRKFRGTTDAQYVAPDQLMAVTACSGSYCWYPIEKYQVTQVQDGAPSTLTRHDALGRTTLAASRQQDGVWTHVLESYNARGLLEYRSEPWRGGNAWVYTTYLYDSLGRTTQKRVPKQHEDGRGDMVTAYSYSGRTTNIQVCGSNDSGTGNCLNLSRTKDSLGRYVETRDAQNGRTRFWYEANGNVAAIEDAVGTVTRAVYNAVGQRTSVNDPNQGQWSFVYNALGEVKQQTDARGVATTMSYDVLGRPSMRTANVDATGDGVAEIVQDAWVYDPANAKGALHVAQRAIAGAVERSDTLFYDTLSRPVQTYYAQASASGTQGYFIRAKYDSYYGRTIGREYPNGEAVQLLYSSYGHAVAEKDPSTGTEYRRTNSVNARGQATQETFGNGVTLSASYQLQTGQLTGLHYVGSVGSLRRLEYGYDVFGNVKRQSLNNGASREDYAYDSLHRLVQSIRSGAASGTVSYGYDAVGNLKKKTDFSADAASAYSYTGGTCGGGANAVKSVQLAAGGARTYCYDANGNLTGDSAGLSLSFDHQNMATKVTRGGQTDWFRYGPDGMRTRSWGADGARIYLPGYEHRTDTGETKVYVGDYAVISRTGATRKVEYLLKDRLGSVDAVANAAGAVIETRGYDAFGKPRNGDWTDRAPPKIANVATTPKGFTQHEHLNQLELIHMNGRVFDFHLGRFTGVDPFIQFPLNSQSLNPYSYILNNPLSGTDPSGYAACGAEIKDGEVCEVKTERKVIEKSTGSRTVKITTVSETHTVANNGGVVYVTPGQGREAHDRIEAAMIGGASDRKSGPSMGPTPMNVGTRPGKAWTYPAFCTSCADQEYYLYDPNEPSGLAKVFGDMIGSFRSPDQHGFRINPFTGQPVPNPQAIRAEVVVNIISLALPAKSVGIFSRADAAAQRISERALLRQAVQARDELAEQLARNGYQPATVVGAYNSSTGQVVAAASRGGGRGCAEGVCEQLLGGPSQSNRFTRAVRPRTGKYVDVCENCEAAYGRSAFPENGTTYKSDR